MDISATAARFAISRRFFSILLRVSSCSTRERESRSVSAEVSPLVARSSSTASCALASESWASISAESACCARIALSSSISRLCASASAERSCNSASRAACSTSGLLSSRITVSAWTAVPGRTTILSTRASVDAGIQRTFSGTSVPVPRTCRTMSPRRTVSMNSPERSTSGAAGFIREIPNVPAARTTVTAAPIQSLFRRRALTRSGLATSIDTRVG